MTFVEAGVFIRRHLLRRSSGLDAVRGFAAALGILFFGAAQADQTDAQLDQLFVELQESEPADADRLTSAIWTIWLQSGVSETDEVMGQGMRAMRSHDYDTALERFTRATEMLPNFAESWNKRATVYYLMGDFDNSARDIKQTLILEPRHFGALSGLGLIYMALHQNSAAIAAFRQALEIHPYLSDARYFIEVLEKEQEKNRI
jgi:tetratricopeptide (TPR) repeat protein